MWRRNGLLLLAAAVIATVPLFISFDREEVFGGADAEAQAQIGQIAPDYQPWALPLWEPPSGEIASLLFALQAALGAGVLGYCIGYSIGFRQGQAPAEREPGAEEARRDVHR